MRESDIEKHLVKRVKALGGEVRKVQWIGRRGAPDRVVFIPPKYWTRSPIWVELKAPGVKPEPHQLREHERMRKMGQRVVVIDSIEGVEELLSWRAPPTSPATTGPATRATAWAKRPAR